MSDPLRVIESTERNLLPENEEQQQDKFEALSLSSIGGESSFNAVFKSPLQVG